MCFKLLCSIKFVLNVALFNHHTYVFKSNQIYTKRRVISIILQGLVGIRIGGRMGAESF